MMQVLQATTFRKTVKKLHKNQKSYLDNAIRTIIEDPAIGQAKTGDLAGVRVYKFKMTNQFTLLAYCYESKTNVLKLLAIGSHENFYLGLKKNLNN